MRQDLLRDVQFGRENRRTSKDLLMKMLARLNAECPQLFQALAYQQGFFRPRKASARRDSCRCASYGFAKEQSQVGNSPEFPADVTTKQFSADNSDGHLNVAGLAFGAGGRELA